MSFRILHVYDVGGIDGISAVVPRLIEAQNALKGVDSRLLIPSDSFTESRFSFPVYATRRPWIIRRIVLSEFRPHLVVFHSVYKKEYLLLAGLLRRESVPYAIVPHGGFSVVVQRKNSLKKRLANMIAFSKFISNSAAVVYLTHGEKSMSAFDHNNVFVVPNGIDAPADISQNPHDEYEHTGQLKLSYIGRIDFFYKGIDILLEAIYHAREILKRNNAIVDLCGPGRRRAIERLNAMVADLGISDVVNCKGPVIGMGKDKQFRETDILVLTSRSEGMPTVVLEALSYGVPCLVTDGTNMGDILAANGAGWACRLSSESISHTLESAVQQYTENSTSYKRNARRLAKEYTWTKVAEQSLNAYRKVLEETHR